MARVFFVPFGRLELNLMVVAGEGVREEVGGGGRGRGGLRRRPSAQTHSLAHLSRPLLIYLAALGVTS